MSSFPAKNINKVKIAAIIMIKALLNRSWKVRKAKSVLPDDKKDKTYIG